jgi:hypothetical protein
MDAKLGPLAECRRAHFMQIIKKRKENGMKSKLAALSMALAVGLVSGCGGGGGDGTTQASGGSSGTASPAAPGTTPSTPVTPPTTTNPPATVTELQTTKALLKSALADGGRQPP